MWQWLKDFIGWNDTPKVDPPLEEVDQYYRNTIATELRRLRDGLKVAKVELTTARATAAEDYHQLRELLTKHASPEAAADKFTLPRLMEEAQIRLEIEELEARLAKARARADEIEGKLSLGDKHKLLLDQAKRTSQTDATFNDKLNDFDLRVQMTTLELNTYTATFAYDWLEDPVLTAIRVEVEAELNLDESERDATKP